MPNNIQYAYEICFKRFDLWDSGQAFMLLARGT